MSQNAPEPISEHLNFACIVWPDHSNLACSGPAAYSKPGRPVCPQAEVSWQGCLGDQIQWGSRSQRPHLGNSLASYRYCFTANRIYPADLHAAAQQLLVIKQLLAIETATTVLNNKLHFEVSEYHPSWLIVEFTDMYNLD